MVLVLNVARYSLRFSLLGKVVYRYLLTHIAIIVIIKSFFLAIYILFLNTKFTIALVGTELADKI
jgi:hypothetical protein